MAGENGKGWVSNQVSDLLSNAGENNVHITRPAKRLWQECNPIDQPEGTYRFLLNGINGTSDGNENFVSNEHSNQLILVLDNIIGECYLGNNTNLLFAINEDNSEIGIFRADSYKQLINWSGLGFTVTNQIQATLRVKNNKRVVYFVDGNNDARIVNVDAMYLHYTIAYQNWLNGGSVGSAPLQWNIESFDLITTYSAIPEFTSAKILNYGSILPGSYNFAIRLLDENLNATNFITTSNVINIYNDNLTLLYENIYGSRNANNDAQSYTRANKSIQLNFNNLDNNYPYYQVAIIQSASNTGTILSVLLSDPIDINNLEYIYTGNDYELGSIDLAQVKIDKLNIKNPSTIEQIENRLILGNGSDVNYEWCTFQQYASQIKTDLTLYESTLNSVLDSSNGKNPISSFILKGYMPGEAYCYGVVYIMTDLSESPVYHIPGPVPGDSSTVMQTTELEIGYSAIHNCSNEPYWGNDYQGNPLLGQKVRINTFPFRSQLSSSNGKLVNNSSLTYLTQYNGIITTALIGSYPTTNGQYSVITFNIRYKLVGIPSVFTQTITLTYATIGQTIQYYTGDIEIDSDFPITTQLLDLTNFTPAFTITTSNINTGGPFVQTTNILGIKFENITQPPGTIGFYIVRTDRLDGDKLVIDNGIIGPNVAATNSAGTGGALYNTFSRFYPQIYPTGSSEFPSGYPYSQNGILDTNTAWLFYPEHQFRNNQKIPAQFRTEGEFIPFNVDYPYSPDNMADNFYSTITGDRNVAMITYNKFGSYARDTQPGTVYQSATTTNVDVLCSYKIIAFNFANTGLLDTIGTEYAISSVNYINAVDYYYSGSNTFYNASCDNKICIVQTAANINTILNTGNARNSGGTHGFGINNYSTLINPEESTFPNPNYFNLKYVSLLSGAINIYSDFLTRTYYKEHNNIIMFADIAASTSKSVSLFAGDTNISQYNPVSTTYRDCKASTGTDDSTWKIIAGSLLLVAAVAVTIVTYGGASATIPIAAGTLTAALVTTAVSLAVSYGITLITSGLKSENLRKMMITDYPNGLYDAINDAEVAKMGGGSLGYPVPPTEIIYRWYADILQDIYIESSVNAPLRTKITAAGTDFLSLKAESTIAFQTIESYLLEKLTTMDISTGSGRLYRGYPMGEYYDINLDFLRSNREKDFFELPLNYDCCSDTVNDFLNRIWYSEQSFQEETIDNCRIFLPNNYRDIESEHGEIVNIFRKKDELYVHTTEALWYLPKQLQERITGDITSFIGTGDFFSVPPKPVVDDDLGTAGSQDKWATVKTKKGIFFTNQLENKVYWFGDQGLQVVSIIGNETWFKSNLSSQFNQLYNSVNGIDYPNIANPANINGIGLLATYDNYYNRILLTKKDYYPTIPYTLIASTTADANNTIKFNGTNFILALANQVGGFNYTTVYLNDPNIFENYSFTISFSIDDLAWIGFHSYIPNFYVRNQNDYYAFLVGKGLYKHNIVGHFQTFFDTYYPFIMEYVSLSNPLTIKDVHTLLLNTEARIFNPITQQFIPRQDYTFNQAIFYNTIESTGLLNLINKDSQANPNQYMQQQLVNNAGIILIAKREKYWHINDIRNYVINKNVELFVSDWNSISSQYYIDKVPNPTVTSFTKNWYELESFKDEYMIIRLYLYNSALSNVNLTMKYSIEHEVISTR